MDFYNTDNDNDNNNNNNDNQNLKENKANKPKIWHPQHEIILKEWAEITASYRWLHREAHMKFRKQNICFTLPIIILSTIAGTANFSQGSLSGDAVVYVPIIIGTINLIAGLITTIAEFLKISELSESHRSSSLFFGKLSRNIKVELSLPWSDRTVDGKDFIKMCRADLDRLLEQSAIIPKDIVSLYEKRFSNLDICQPELLKINKVNIYHNEKEVKEEHVGNIVAQATRIFSKQTKKKSISDIMSPVLTNLKNTVDSTKKLDLELGIKQDKKQDEKEDEKDDEKDDEI